MQQYRDWLAQELEALGLEEAVLAPYLFTALQHDEEGQHESHEALASLLESIRPNGEEEIERWCQFCKKLPIFYANPDLIPSSSPSEESHHSNEENGYQHPASPLMPPTPSPIPSPSLPAVAGPPPDDGDQNKKPLHHRQRTCSSGYKLLEELCHEVAEAALFGLEEDGDGGAEEKKGEMQQHQQHHHVVEGSEDGSPSMNDAMTMGWGKQRYYHSQHAEGMMMMMPAIGEGGAAVGAWAEYHEGGGQEILYYMDAADEEVALRESSLGALMDVFPQCEPSALMMVFDRCGLDVELTVRCIETALQPKVLPCRYFLAGFCARSDCMFSHEIEGTTCIYWLMGTCRGGPKIATETGDPSCCPFLHDVIPPPLPPPQYDLVERSFGQDGYPVAELEEEESKTNAKLARTEENFPSLSTAVAVAAVSQPTTNASSPAPSGCRSSNKGKSFLQALSTQQGSVGGNSGIRRGGTALSSAAATDGGRRRGGMPAGAREVRARIRADMESGRRGGSSSDLGKGLRSRKVLEAMWVMGGDDVRIQYAIAREEAGVAARARNTLFMRATEAFQRGDKLAAKRLGQQGRNMNAVMKARHKEAALAIFASRNASEKVIYEQGILDLHGLHVSEALETLDELLPDLIECGLKEAILVTGSGHHSGAISQGQARLLPAVERYLQEINADYRHVQDLNRHKGALCLGLNKEMAVWWSSFISSSSS